MFRDKYYQDINVKKRIKCAHALTVKFRGRYKQEDFFHHFSPSKIRESNTTYKI